MKVKNTAYVNMEVDFKALSDQLLKKLDAKGPLSTFAFFLSTTVSNSCKL